MKLEDKGDERVAQLAFGLKTAACTQRTVTAEAGEAQEGGGDHEVRQCPAPVLEPGRDLVHAVADVRFVKHHACL